MRLLRGFLLIVLVAGIGCTTPADLVLHNGRIVTIEDDYGTVQALAVRGDRIVELGSDDAIAAHVGPATRVIDLEGRLAIPGFIDGHAHFTGMGEARMTLDLMHVQDWEEVIEMVRDAVAEAEPGEWILGRGWHQDKWRRSPPNAVEGFPTHQDLSAVTPNNPVCLRHASGHACFFNANAMSQAGIDATTPDPPGGEILHDNDGQPIGIFRETAQSLVSSVHTRQISEHPELAEARLREAIRLADRECIIKGVTSFQDAGSPFKTIDVLKDMVQRGEISTRLWVMVRSSNNRVAERMQDYIMEGVGNHHLTVRALKRTFDGALGPRGAWLLEPYNDLPSSTGLNTASVESVTETARLARKFGVQLCVHAIGDRANREVLDIFENAFDDPADLQRERWRVEHAQHLHPDDIPRFSKLGVIASMQGVHCTSDSVFVVDRLGHDRAEHGAYVWRSLWDSGAVVSNGTDAPVEDVDPIQSFYATVSRRNNTGTRFFPEQCLDRMETLKSYTINCAYAAFEEDLKGSLKPGKLADIVVLSKDILTCPEDHIPQAKVLYTIVGGQILYNALEPD